MAAFPDLLRTQVRRMLTGAQQYLAAAVYLDTQRLPELAGRMYAHAEEQRGNGLRMVQYLLDRDLPVTVGGLDTIRSEFDSPRDAIAFLLDREQEHTDRITELAAGARADGDLLGEQFVQWFLQEQTADLADMTTLLTVLDRAPGNLFDVEEFIRRELRSTVVTDGGAPKMAGEKRARNSG